MGKSETVVDKLNDSWKELDEFQESEAAQEDKEMMYLIGEAMGSLDNLIDYIKNK